MISDKVIVILRTAEKETSLKPQQQQKKLNKTHMHRLFSKALKLIKNFENQA